MKGRLKNIVRHRRLKSTLGQLLKLLIFSSILLLIILLLLQGPNKKQNKEEKRQKEKEAVAIVSSFLISKEGVIIGRHTSESLPQLIANLPPLHKEEKVEGEEIRITLSLIAGLNEKGLIVKTAKIYNQDLMELVLEENIKVIYNISLDVKEAPSSLQIMLSSFKIEGKGLKEIDLRFGKPVVRF